MIRMAVDGRSHGRKFWWLLCSMVLFLLGVSVLESGADTLAALCRKDGKVRFFESTEGKILRETELVGKPLDLLRVPETLYLLVSSTALKGRMGGVLTWFGALTGSAERSVVLNGCRKPGLLRAFGKKSVLVGCVESGRILVLSAISGLVRRSYSVGFGMRDLLFHPSTRQVLVLRESGELFLLDLENRALEEVEAVSGVTELALDPQSGVVALVKASPGGVSFFDPEAGDLEGVIKVEGRVRSLRHLPRSPYLLLETDGIRDLVKIDTDTKEVADRLAVGRGVTDILLHPWGEAAWVVSPVDDSVMVIDLVGWKLRGSFTVAGGPYRLEWVEH